ncbi:MAG: hypothetical protein HYX68_29375 [Planctomycetes bacterium]|nr:hypothetical protein [Planctomycetota bacterium]
MTDTGIPASITNPDHLYAPGSITFFVDLRTSRVDCEDHPARHADMLNRDGCALGKKYLTADQHDFEGIPLTRSKVTYFGIIAGRFAFCQGRLLISIWNELDEQTARKAIQALIEHVPAVRDNRAMAFVTTHGYKNVAKWFPVAESESGAASY